MEDLVKGCLNHQALHPYILGFGRYVHVDFADPFSNRMFLIVVDDHSKLLEVIHVPMLSTTAVQTIEALKLLFGSYGIPELLVTMVLSLYLMKFCHVFEIE